MVALKRFFMKFYLAIIIVFLYIPIGVLVVLSFNGSGPESSGAALLWNGIGHCLQMRMC